MFNKTLIAAAAATGLFANSAASESYFTYIDDTPMEASTQIMLGEVVADAAGEVVIYDYNAGEFGEILGREPVAAGANADFDVSLTVEPINDIAAVLYVGEASIPENAAAWVEIDIVEDMDDM